MAGPDRTSTYRCGGTGMALASMTVLMYGLIQESFVTRWMFMRMVGYSARLEALHAAAR